MKNRHEPHKRFPGFKAVYRKDFFTFPLALFIYLNTLSGAECLILLYILRATLGYQKTSDKISLGQIRNGNTEKNLGTGLSISQIRRGLVSLEEKGFIKVGRHFHSPSIVHLVLENGEESIERVETTATASDEIIRLIRLFSSVSPHKVEEFARQKKHVEAMRKLVESYGSEQIESVIMILPTTNGKPYAPTIDSPYELSEKITKLISFVHKVKAGEEEKFRVVF